MDKGNKLGKSVNLWNSNSDHLVWNADIEKGKYKLSIYYAFPNDSSILTFHVGEKKIPIKAIASGSWDKVKKLDLDDITIEQAGKVKIMLKPGKEEEFHAINFYRLEMEKE